MQKKLGTISLDYVFQPFLVSGTLIRLKVAMFKLRTSHKSKAWDNFEAQWLRNIALGQGWPDFFAPGPN